MGLVDEAEPSRGDGRPIRPAFIDSSWCHHPSIVPCWAARRILPLRPQSRPVHAGLWSIRTPFFLFRGHPRRQPVNGDEMESVFGGVRALAGGCEPRIDDVRHHHLTESAPEGSVWATTTLRLSSQHHPQMLPTNSGSWRAVVKETGATTRT